MISCCLTSPRLSHTPSCLHALPCPASPSALLYSTLLLLLHLACYFCYLLYPTSCSLLQPPLLSRYFYSLLLLPALFKLLPYTDCTVPPVFLLPASVYYLLPSTTCSALRLLIYCVSTACCNNLLPSTVLSPLLLFYLSLSLYLPCPYYPVLNLTLPPLSFPLLQPFPNPLLNLAYLFLQITTLPLALRCLPGFSATCLPCLYCRLYLITCSYLPPPSLSLSKLCPP